MNEFLQQLATACVPVLCLLITAGGAYLVALLRKKTALLQQQTANDVVSKYMDMAVDAVDQAVTYTAQTFVDALKAEDAFTKERQAEAFNIAKNKVLQILGDTVVLALEGVYGDFEEWLNTRIEQVCRDLKSADTPTPLLWLPGDMEIENGFEIVEDEEPAADNDEPQSEGAPEVEDPDADYEY